MFVPHCLTHVLGNFNMHGRKTQAYHESFWTCTRTNTSTNTHTYAHKVALTLQARLDLITQHDDMIRKGIG